MECLDSGIAVVQHRVFRHKWLTTVCFWYKYLKWSAIECLDMSILGDPPSSI